MTHRANANEYFNRISFIVRYYDIRKTLLCISENNIVVKEIVDQYYKVLITTC